MAGLNHFREIKKDCTLKKNNSLQLNIVPYKEKKVFFRNSYTKGGNSRRTSDIYDLKMKITSSLKLWNPENVRQNHQVLFK